MLFYKANQTPQTAGFLNEEIMFTITQSRINRDPHVLMGRIERATRNVEDPVFERFAQKWPILSAKLLNIYGLRVCYGEEKQPYVRNAELQLTKVIKNGVEKNKRAELIKWLQPGIFPTLDTDLTYLERKRLEHCAPNSTFLQLAAAVIPITTQAGEVANSQFLTTAHEYTSTIDTLHQHRNGQSTEQASFVIEDEYTD